MAGRNVGVGTCSTLVSWNHGSNVERRTFVKQHPHDLNVAVLDGLDKRGSPGVIYRNISWISAGEL